MISNTQGMTEYTKWWIAHPWHVTKGMPVPPDCDCEWCVAQRAKQLTLQSTVETESLKWESVTTGR